ncbi:MAG: endoribonuclease MazF [Spirochaetes bacterium]|nr:MAG: endoribonuclease MazF [Spirochaetota bacterium]
MVKDKKYFPERSDVVWLDFSPQTGHEHSGRRPAVVLSPGEYNKKTGLAIFCPITSKKKGYPFEVGVTGIISGVILSDQVKSLDWRTRNAEFVMRLPEDILKELSDNLKLLIY